jgi:hypothetical protein
MLPLLCHSGRKEGIPIPFLGYVCVGLSPVCSSFGVISEAVSIAPRGDVCRNSKVKDCAKEGCHHCGNTRDCGK